MKRKISLIPLLISFPLLLLGQRQEEKNIPVIPFNTYDPPSTLVTKQTLLTRAKYPFVDIHNHQWVMTTQHLAKLIPQMDSLNMAVMVNLSGRTGDYIKAGVANIKNGFDGRFLLFANISFDGFGTQGWTEKTVRQLDADINNGASGLKIYKNLGLTAVDSAGNRIQVDHPALDPVWALCGKKGIPVLIHTGEPAVFWQPVDEKNERLLEMLQFPDRWRGDTTKYPPFETVMAEQHRMFKKHPKTIFINAHLGWFGHDLERLGNLLDEIPNMYTEIGAVLAELGRQPAASRRFFIKYQNRILFGKDIWSPAEYYAYFRVLETDDEYFDYYRRRHAFWKMYGMALPDPVLKKVYYENAVRIFPSLKGKIKATPLTGK